MGYLIQVGFYDHHRLLFCLLGLANRKTGNTPRPIQQPDFHQALIRT